MLGVTHFRIDETTGDIFDGEHRGKIPFWTIPTMKTFVERPRICIPKEKFAMSEERLRKAIEEIRTALGDSRIITHPGIGYEFHPDIPEIAGSDKKGIGFVSCNFAGMLQAAPGPTGFSERCAAVRAEAAELVATRNPDVFLVQEALRVFNTKSGRVEHSVLLPPGHRSVFIEAFDPGAHSAPERLARMRANGWDASYHIAQGMVMGVKEDWIHAPVFGFEPSADQNTLQPEVIRVEQGLNLGNRETEPRLFAILHLLARNKGLAWDIMIVNVHLPTMRGEREGIPSREVAGSAVRLAQLEILTHGVVSRWEEWKRKTAPSRGPTLWVLGGDFNCTPDSREMAYLKACRFLDLNVNKGCGTKRAKGEVDASITVDYLLAGPLFTALHGYRAPDHMRETPNPPPVDTSKVSDHLPVFGWLPFSVLGWG